MAQVAAHPAEASHKAEAGIVVFGSSMGVRYANQRARDLLQRLRWGATEFSEKIDLLDAIVDLGMTVREQWQMQREPHDPAAGEARRIVQTGGGPVALCAFGIPDRERGSQFHIMVVIDKAGDRELRDAVPGVASLRTAWR